MQLKYLFLIVFLQLFSAEMKAQNVPILSQASNPNTFTNMGTPQEIYVPTGMHNSVATFVPIIPISDTASVNGSSPVANVKQQITYLDGFQRSFQSITRNISNVNGVSKNLIQIYDNRPQRDQYNFLTYASNQSTLNTTAFQDQRAYYNSLFSGEGYSSFSKIVNTSNDAERSTSSYSPGKSGVGLDVASRTKLITNPASQIIIWNLDVNGVPLNLGYYKAGVLTGADGADPDASGSNQTVASPRAKFYKDKDGKLILKLIADSSYTIISGNNVTATTTYSYTYYVYDVKGNLRVTITPKAFKYYQNQGSFSTAILNNLCFQYQYDVKGRLSGSMKPGEGGFTYIVYDRKDRPIMRQTPNEKLVNEWELTFQDALDRTKVTSIYKDIQTTPLDYNGWQTAIDTWSGTGSYSDLLNYLITPAMESQYPVGDNAVNDPANNAYAGSYITNNSIMTINYYDNYAKLDANNTLFAECQTAVGLPSVSAPGQEVPTQGRPYGTPTSSLVRILRSPNAAVSPKIGDWRTTVSFSDDKGRGIVSKSFVTDNMQSAPHLVINTDYSCTKYDFANRILIVGHSLTNINSQSNILTASHKEYTKYQYDAISGAVVKSVHQIDGGDWKTITSFAYDDMGRVARKTLGAGGEVQDMSYNIRGQLIGINGVYAETGNKGGVSKTFGESLKFDYGFSSPRYDGKLAGVVWRGGSTLNMYAYGYDYTQNGALKRADFNDMESNNWAHVSMDYSVSNLFYDKNGNILSMKEKGVKPVTGIVDMDNLSYKYEAGDISNRLTQVNDAGNTVSYGAGDFLGTVANTTYDPNGNLMTNTGDKNISNITYTRFNKPQTVTFLNRSTVEYSYDAMGNKLEELIIDYPTAKRKRTDYIGNAVYQNTYLTSAGNGTDADSLQYLLTSEGRTTFTSSPVKATEEFFVKDHLGNVRSNISVTSIPIVTYLGTYELASAHLEDLVFDNIEDIRDIKPGGSGDNTMAANLNGGDSKRIIGSSLLLHVMAGDKVGMNVSTFYNGYDSKQDVPLGANTVVSSIIGTLVGGAGGFSGSEDHNTNIVQSVFTAPNYTALTDLINQNTDATRPKAYLNYALFDEKMQIVKEMSGAFQATGNNDWVQIGTTSPIEVPTNGYLAIYLSNQSTNLNCMVCSDVYFDQLLVNISQGKLLQENHYYPHGLPIFGLGSTTADINYKVNREKYQSNEYITDQKLNWMSFGARQYDPQIGRFLGVDPLATFGGQDVYSPYAAMGNQPESSVDPNGMQPSVPMVNNRTERDNPGSGGDGGSIASAGWYSGGKMEDITSGSGVGADGLINFNERIDRAVFFNTLNNLIAMCGKSANSGQGGNGVGGIGAANDRNTGAVDAYQFSGQTLGKDGWVTASSGKINYKYAFTDNNTNSNGNFGVMFELYVSGLDGFSDYKWIQSVETEAPAYVGKARYATKFLDGDGKHPENAPFYFSPEDNTSQKARAINMGKYVNMFQDEPGSFQGSTNYTFNAELSLVGKINGHYQTIITFNWGYFYFDSKAISYGPFVTTPSDFQNKLIPTKP